MVPATDAITMFDVVENIAKEVLTEAAVTPDMPAVLIADTTAFNEPPVIDVPLIVKVPDTDAGFCTVPFTV